MTPLEAALDYARRRGWAIFPASADGRKHPFVNAWQKVATKDAGQLRAWWRKWPNAVPALPTGKTSGLVVFDIDVKKARANGFDTLADLGLAILPDTPMSHTSSGGLHVFFSTHPMVDVRNSIGKAGLGPGLDVRGTGGFVVLPSPGSGYWWDPHWNFDTCVPLPAPAWLGHRRRQSANVVTGQPRRFDAQTVLEEACEAIRNAGPGDKWRAIRREAFIAGCLVRDRLVPESRARHELDAALLALRSHCVDFAHAIKGMEGAFAEGLAAARRTRR